MQFLQAMNWLHKYLPRMAEAVWPLRVFLEEHMAGAKRRFKRVASNRAISAGEWSSELIGAWDAAQDLVAYAVALFHPETGVGGAHVPGRLRRTSGDFSHAGASGGARRWRASRGYNSRASGFPEWYL